MEQENHKSEPSSTVLVGFNGRVTHAIGQLNLELVAKTVRVKALFLVKASVSPYNAFLGHPWIHSVAAITSTFHQKIKILTSDEVIKIEREQLVARHCQQSIMSVSPRVLLIMFS